MIGTFRTLALLCLFATPALIEAKAKPAAVIDSPFMYDSSDDVFFLPRSDTEVTKLNWVQMKRPNSPAGLEVLKLWCEPKNLRFCVFMDDTGFIAGCQISLEKEICTDGPYDWTELGFTEWKVTGQNGKDKYFWSNQLYFVSAEYLKIDQATRIAKRDFSQKTLLQDKAVWASGFNGTLYAVPRNSVSDLIREDFTFQRTIFIDQRTYFYKMSADLECRADTLLPWFIDTTKDGQQLYGMGFYVFINKKTISDNPAYFNDVYLEDIELTIPKGPDCLYDLSHSYELLTFNVYLLEWLSG